MSATLIIDENNVVVHSGNGPVQLLDAKDPDSNPMDYRISWGDWLRSGETITGRSWISDGEYVIADSSNSASETVGNKTYTFVETVWLTGGAAGNTGLITNRITTNQGRQADRSFKLLCKEQ